MQSNPSSVSRPSFSARVGNFITRARRFVGNALFVMLLVGLFIWLCSALFGGKKIARGSALVVQPKGAIVEQLAGFSPSDPSAFTGGVDETLLKDQLDAIAAAKNDARIGALFVDLSEMGPSGMTKLEDLRRALVDFKTSGKKVVAYADSFTQGPYYVASAADEIWMHPMSGAVFEGLSRYRTFYKDAIDRLGIDWHVFKVGEYKSAVEPYIRNDMSPEAKEADAKWLGDLWGAWLKDVAAARKLTPDALRAYIDQMPANAVAAKGDLAKVALDAKLVDTLGDRGAVRARLIQLVGETTDAKTHLKTFKHVSVADYLDDKGGDRNGEHGGDAVAVVVAVGEILDGTQPAGSIGGDSTAALIRKARNDKHVKAIVLRVDSGGGSAFASDVIRGELAAARAQGLKVVVSMGTVAASGGYWISTASDEIWASPETITGSIGIFGMFPSVDKAMAKYLGMHVDGVGTTRFAGAQQIGRPFDPEVGTLIQAAINHGYEEFLGHVSEARKLSRDQVDKIARGRVWSGQDAFDRKLVDKLGDLPAALASAKAMSGLDKEARVWYVQRDKKLAEQLMESLRSGESLARALGVVAEPAPLPPMLRAVGAELKKVEDLVRLNDPHGVYAYSDVAAY